MADNQNRRLLKLLADWRKSDDPPQAFLDVLSRNRMEIRPGKLTRSYVQTLGFAPATVFDIGVHRGTSWLYSSFPDARLVLVDPMPRPDHLDRLLGDRPNVEYLQKAAGAARPRPGSRPAAASRVRRRASARCRPLAAGDGGAWRA